MVSFNVSSGTVDFVVHSNKEYPLTEQFMAYKQTYLLKSTTLTPFRRGGAYLFVPTSDAVDVAAKNATILVVEGPLVSEQFVTSGNFGSRTLRLYHSNIMDLPSLEIRHFVKMDSSEFDNTEYITRFTTNIESNKVIYTDSQGLSMKKGHRRSDRPLPFNYFPCTSVAFIEDLVWYK